MKIRQLPLGVLPWFLWQLVFSWTCHDSARIQQSSERSVEWRSPLVVDFQGQDLRYRGVDPCSCYCMILHVFSSEKTCIMSHWHTFSSTSPQPFRVKGLSGTDPSAAMPSPFFVYTSMWPFRHVLRYVPVAAIRPSQVESTAYCVEKLSEKLSQSYTKRCSWRNMDGQFS